MGFLSTATNFLTGGVGKKVLDIVDDSIDTASERREDDAADTRDARGMQIQGGLSQLVILYKYNTSSIVGFIILLLIFVHVSVDAVSRMIRPTVTIRLLGGLFGHWTLPSLEGVDPFWETFSYIVLTFWFGGRFVMKDVIPVIRVWRKLRKDKDNK